MSLPNGWGATALGDLTGLVTSGSRGWAKYYASQGSAFIRVQNVRRGWVKLDLTDVQYVSPPAGAEGERTRLQHNDVLISITADLGRIGLFEESISAYINQHIALVRLREPKLAPFIARYLTSATGQADLGLMDRGVTRAGLGLDDIRAVPVPLPPLAEQRRIVTKLDALFARLARVRAVVERSPKLLERLKLSILRSGCTGGLTEEWRGSSAALGSVEQMLSGVPAPQQGRGGREATDKIIPGAAGLSINDPGTPLPEGWKWVSLLRIAKQETGHTPSRSQPSYWDGGINWIGIRDAGAHHGRRIGTTIQTISEAGLENSSARLLPAGTVCLSRTASVGYVTIMAKSMATSQDFATWTCTEALAPEYLMYALMAEGEDIRRFGMGSTHTTIYFPEIRALHIALPPVKEQKEIVARIKQALSLAARLGAEVARSRALLERLEAAILTKAFKGELLPQDPNDEPASVPLERIRAQRAAAAPASKTKRGRRLSSVTR